MAFEEGHAKVGGRVKGVPNKSTVQLRHQLREILGAEIENLPTYFAQLTDNRAKIELLIKLMPFVFPKMQNMDLLEAADY
jgi:hypothetical protein